jgi:hypothetical protein
VVNSGHLPVLFKPGNPGYQDFILCSTAGAAISLYLPFGLCSQEAVSLKIRNFYQNAVPPRVAPAVARDRRQRGIARPRPLIADAAEIRPSAYTVLTRSRALQSATCN